MKGLGVLGIISVLLGSLVLFEGREAGEWAGMTGCSWFYSPPWHERCFMVGGWLQPVSAASSGQ